MLLFDCVLVQTAKLNKICHTVLTTSVWYRTKCISQSLSCSFSFFVIPCGKSSRQCCHALQMANWSLITSWVI